MAGASLLPFLIFKDLLWFFQSFHHILHLSDIFYLDSLRIRYPIQMDHLHILVQDGNVNDILYHHMRHSLLSLVQMLYELHLQLLLRLPGWLCSLKRMSWLTSKSQILIPNFAKSSPPWQYPQFCIIFSPLISSPSWLFVVSLYSFPK